MATQSRRSHRFASAAAAESTAPSSTASAGSKRRAQDDSAVDPALSSAANEGAAAFVMTDDAAISTAPPLASASASGADAAANLSPSSPSASARKRAKRSKEGATAAAASTSAVPPARWSTIYSDALHSILKFASLADLSRVVSVSRRWSDAVTTMPPIHATSSMGSALRLPVSHSQPSHGPLLENRLRSRLARHVSSFAEGDIVTSVDFVQLVAESMPWMRRLRVRFDSPGELPQAFVDALTRFGSLRHLTVELGSCSVGALNAMIAASGGLSNLETLWLQREPATCPHLLFAPLTALPLLQSLSLYGINFPCTDSQLVDLRRLTGLTRIDIGSRAYVLDRREVQPGWTNWIAIPRLTTVTEAVVPLLSSLSGLTQLRLMMQCSNLSFFSSLAQLTELHLYRASPEVADCGELVHALSRCARLRSLLLSDLRLTGDHLAMMLPAFPRLESLTLCYLLRVESLRCFATSSLASSLSNLTLTTLPRCRPSELHHLFGLQSLQQITILGLATPISEELKAQFVAGSQRFPRLKPEAIDKPAGWQN